MNGTKLFPLKNDPLWT